MCDNVKRKSIKVFFVESQIAYLKTGKPKKIKPWYKGYGGEVRVATNENGSEIMYTTFGFKWEGESLFLTHAPQTSNSV